MESEKHEWLTSIQRQLAAQAGEAGFAERDDALAHLQLVNVVQGLMAENGDRDARGQAEGLPTAEAVGIVVLCFPDDDPLAGSEFKERLQRPVGELAFAGRDRMAVRVERRLA